MTIDSIQSQSTPDDGRHGSDDDGIVDRFIGHLMEPCRTEHGNIRSFYIREARRMLERNMVRLPEARQRLESAIRIAELVRKVEGLAL